MESSPRVRSRMTRSASVSNASSSSLDFDSSHCELSGGASCVVLVAAKPISIRRARAESVLARAMCVTPAGEGAVDEDDCE